MRVCVWARRWLPNILGCRIQRSRRWKGRSFQPPAPAAPERCCFSCFTLPLAFHRRQSRPENEPLESVSGHRLLSFATGCPLVSGKMVIFFSFARPLNPPSCVSWCVLRACSSNHCSTPLSLPPQPSCPPHAGEGEPRTMKQVTCRQFKRSGRLRGATTTYVPVFIKIEGPR